jgi:hypothetical protein
MPVRAAKLLVSREENLVCIKILGRANFDMSLNFKRLVEGEITHGAKYFVIDLSQCVCADSTFLGDLAGLGLQLEGTTRNGEGMAIRLLNTPKNILDSIEKTKNCLQAHKLLMKLDPANVDKFRDVTAFLAEDVRRQETSVQ